MTDIGNEPDDSQTMVRLMLYSNVIDIEGLVASTSIHATAGSTTYKGIDTNNKVFFGAGRTWAASVAFNF